MHQIGHGAAFPQKLRIADHVKLRAMAIVTFNGCGDFFTCFHRHSAFIDNDAVAGQDACDLARDLFDEAKIDIAIGLLWRGHGNENDL